jgi:hypothetical protein
MSAAMFLMAARAAGADFLRLQKAESPGLQAA